MPSPLRQYQRDGVDALLQAFSRQKGALLADEPGVGKTAQAIEVSNLLCPRSILVVCPAVAKVNWTREFETWSIWGVPEIATTKKPYRPANFAVVNYDILDKVEGLDRKWDLIVFDEAHYLKNPTAKRSKFGRRLANKAGRVLLLTGTPIENRPVELWNLMVVMGWIPPGSYMEYVKKHCGYRKRTIYIKGRPRIIVDVSGATNIPELREFLKSKGMVRRRKADVIPELPPKTYRILELPRPHRWRSAILQEFLGDREDCGGRENRPGEKVPDKSQIKYFKSLAAIAAKTGDRKRLVQAVAEARRLDGIDKIDGALKYIVDCLEQEEKVGVFCYHREVFERLGEGLKKYGVVGICGDTPAGKRQKAVDSFMSDPECRVFVGQIKAAGTAITLTAASHVIFVELDWVPGLMEQAADRFHRLGQKDNVLVDYLVLEDSLDALVASRLIEKQKVLGELLGGGATPLGGGATPLGGCATPLGGGATPSAYEPLDELDVLFDGADDGKGGW